MVTETVMYSIRVKDEKDALGRIFRLAERYGLTYPGSRLDVADTFYRKDTQLHNPEDNSVLSFSIEIEYGFLWGKKYKLSLKFTGTSTQNVQMFVDCLSSFNDQSNQEEDRNAEALRS